MNSRGTNGVYPVGFNTGSLGAYGKFNSVFEPAQPVNVNGYDSTSGFQNYNFANRNDITYNNLHNILLNEEIREYSVMIDSKDRNYQVYPDPFSYDVKFNPLPKSREKINGIVTTFEEPAPTIYSSFTNVRYIKLESVIMPFHNKIKNVMELDADNDVVSRWKVDTTKQLTTNLYTVLSLGEYTDTNHRSTNDVLSESFATIYYDRKINNTHFVGKTLNGIKIFPQDQLSKLNKLRINFMDPYGMPLKCNHVDKQLLSNPICNCTDPDGDDDTDCFMHNLFHPLNPIFQHHLVFKIGVVEPRLRKKNFN